MRSLLGTVTREQAAARTSPMLALFAYSPPRLHFTPAEQRVLSEALGGAVDETLSARLGIPLSAVKARWTRIQERVVRYAPELVAAVRHGRGYGRGNQRRHLILNYVRDHPSELTPYAWPISRLPRFTAADYASRRRPRDLPAAVKPGSSGRVTRRR
jgi:hypothetical protein